MARFVKVSSTSTESPISAKASADAPSTTAGTIVAKGYRWMIAHASRHTSRAVNGSLPGARGLFACSFSIRRRRPFACLLIEFIPLADGVLILEYYPLIPSAAPLLLISAAFAFLGGDADFSACCCHTPYRSFHERQVRARKRATYDDILSHAQRRLFLINSAIR